MSSIEYTNHTPNPIVGCTKKSAGCKECYAIRMAWRLMHSDKAEIRDKYAGTVYKTPSGQLNWTGRINVDHKSMDKVLKQKKSKIFFVNSMGDLFHPNVNEHDQEKVFLNMKNAYWHVFQVLTKHPEKMVRFVNNMEKKHGSFLFRNIWMGATVEDQQEADFRKPYLKIISEKGWITWVSNEPCLQKIDWTGWQFLNWMVTGGENAHKARPLHPYWVAVARDFCLKHNIPFFFKQWGTFFPFNSIAKLSALPVESDNVKIMNVNGNSSIKGEAPWAFKKIGKKAAGNVFFGETYQQMPGLISSKI